MAVVNFLWDNTNLLQEFSEGGAAVASYVTEPDQYGNVVSQRRENESHYYHYDGVGSTTELSAEDGVITDTRRYTAFGVAVEDLGTTAFPFQYIGSMGYYCDVNIGRYYIRRRHYLQLSGRWLSVDPKGNEAIHLNEYVYCSNTPLTSYDPSGCEPVTGTFFVCGRIACLGVFHLYRELIILCKNLEPFPPPRGQARIEYMRKCLQEEFDRAPGYQKGSSIALGIWCGMSVFEFFLKYGAPSGR